MNREVARSATRGLVATNETIHPPRYDETLTVRYWLDVREVIAAGLDPAKAVTGTLFRDTGMNANPADPTPITRPIACEEEKSTYYFEFDYTGAKFWGLIPAIGAPRDLLLDYGMEHAASCPWDPSNDWSMQNLVAGKTEDVVKTPFVTVYSKGKPIWGTEPPCNGPQQTIPPPPPPSYPPR